MQIRTGLHSQLSDVRGKKHPYFKARMIRSRITPRPGPVPVWADDRWKIAQNRAAGSEAATQEPQACGGLQARSPGNRCLWNSPSAEATQAAHTPTGRAEGGPTGLCKSPGENHSFCALPKVVPLSRCLAHSSAEGGLCCMSKASTKLSLHGAQGGAEKTFARILQLWSCAAEKHYCRMTILLEGFVRR